MGRISGLTWCAICVGLLLLPPWALGAAKDTGPAKDEYTRLNAALIASLH